MFNIILEMLTFSQYLCTSVYKHIMAECENLKEITNIFNQIDIETNSDCEKYAYKPYRYIPQPKPKRILPKPIDFEKYVRENCENKFRILDRLTFHDIKRPIIIFFGHFREKCAYHTKWLDRIYQLSIKYGNQIEFIAADLADANVINPKWDPLYFFCHSLRQEDVTPTTFAIDAKKRIHQHYDAYKDIENLSELCENLLNGKLFPSQPMPEYNATKLVKTCVHDNYEEVILKSTKDILLIISLEPSLEYDPNYEKVALQVKDLNVDLVYMEAEKNYIPFEYHIIGYPTIIFIPHYDKNNFIYYEGSRTEENFVDFLKDHVGQPEKTKLKQEQQDARRYRKRKSLILPNDFEVDFNDLTQYLADNFSNSLKVLDRKTVDNVKHWVLIIYMNLQGKCLSHHIQWLDKIHQVAESHSYGIEYFVADYKDIDIINTRWKRSDFITSSNPKDEIPKIFAIDLLKHTYEFTKFTTVLSLFYFTNSLTNGGLDYSECFPKNQNDQLVKTCVADGFNILLKHSKKHLFITFYDPDDCKETEKLLSILEEIAKDIKDNNLLVEVVKFNSKENYVDLEYAHHSYPVHYFIPRHNRKENWRYFEKNLNKEKILEFILSWNTN